MDTDQQQQQQQEEASASAAAVAAAAVLEDLERQHREALQERDALRKQLAAAQEALTQQQATATDQAAVAQTALEQQNAIALEQTKVKAKEEEIQTMQERLDRMQVEGDALRGEIKYVVDVVVTKNINLTNPKSLQTNHRRQCKFTEGSHIGPSPSEIERVRRHSPLSRERTSPART